MLTIAKPGTHLDMDKHLTTRRVQRALLSFTIVLAGCNGVESLGENGDGDLDAGAGGTVTVMAGTAGIATYGGSSTFGGTGGLAAGGSGMAGAGGSETAGAGGSHTGECCVARTLQWGESWPVVPLAVYELEGCGRFEAEKGPDLRCESDMPECAPQPSVVDAAVLNEVLGDPDVLAAIDAAPVSFGVSPPDGGFWVSVDGASISIYEECIGSTCAPIPEGIRTLRTTLIALAAQQSTRGSCKPAKACYDPIGSDDCGVPIGPYQYDIESGTCVQPTEPGACAGDNRFDTAEACTAACWTDPCQGGQPLDNIYDPEECVAIGGDRCYPSAVQACACACARSGVSMDRGCAMTKTAIPIAVCSQAD